MISQNLTGMQLKAATWTQLEENNKIKRQQPICRYTRTVQLHQCHNARLVDQSNQDSWLQTNSNQTRATKITTTKAQSTYAGKTSFSTASTNSNWHRDDSETLQRASWAYSPDLHQIRCLIIQRLPKAVPPVFCTTYTSQVSEIAAILATHHQLLDFTMLTTPRNLYNPRSSCHVASWTPY